MLSAAVSRCQLLSAADSPCHLLPTAVSPRQLSGILRSHVFSVFGWEIQAAYLCLSLLEPLVALMACSGLVGDLGDPWLAQGWQETSKP